MLRKTPGVDENDKEIIFEEILRKTKDPIVLYLHGNTGTRANGHRVDLYKTLRRLGYHVIAIDYRGFADSSDISPTETGCVSDAFHMYSYIKNLTNNPVFVYGHSLGRLIGFAHEEAKNLCCLLCSGTGIGLHMVSVIDKSNIDNPRGVILEAPFNNMKDEIKKHPFSWVGSAASSLQSVSVCTLNGLRKDFTSKHFFFEALTETLSVTSIKIWIACLLWLAPMLINDFFLSLLRMPFWQLFRHLPWFETTILKPIYDNNFRFESDQHISEFRTPVMILHSENDRVIPFELGYQLYRSALETRGKAWGPVEFHRFEGKYGHKFIVKSNSFAGTIDQFIRRYKDATYWTSEQTQADWWIIYTSFLSFEFYFHAVDIICNLPHHLLLYSERHFLSLRRRVKCVWRPKLIFSTFFKFFSFGTFSILLEYRSASMERYNSDEFQIGRISQITISNCETAKSLQNCLFRETAVIFSYWGAKNGAANNVANNFITKV